MHLATLLMSLVYCFTCLVVLTLLPSTAAVIFAIICVALIVGWGITARLKISLAFLFLGAWCLLYFIVSAINGLPVFRHFLIFISASLVYFSSALASRAVISTVMSSILLHALATPLGLTAGSEGNKSVTNDGADEFQIISVSLLGFYYLFDRKNHTARTSAILVAINALIIESRRYVGAALLTLSFWGLPLKRPFFWGVIVAVSFPILSFLLASGFGFEDSLASRARQILYMYSEAAADPSVLILGAGLKGAQDIPAFFWWGDTKFIGSIFQYGILFWFGCILILFRMSKSVRLTDFQRFLLGWMSFGYLGGLPNVYLLIFFLGLLRR